jgi:hypothetical protein
MLEMRSDPTFSFITRAPESNIPATWKTNLEGNACWASFAVWKSIAGIRPRTLRSYSTSSIPAEP